MQIGKIIAQSGVVFIIAACCALVTYVVKGAPQRYLVVPVEFKDQIVVPVGQISIDQIITDYGGKVLWIDARSRSQWMSDGVVGALFISSDPREDLADLIDQNMEALFQAEVNKTPIIVYCANVGCSDSKMVTEKIQETGISAKIYQLFGGAGSVINDSRIKKKND